ncbi:MAG: FAD-dependent oxidoreductase, partial [Acidobacteriota bacterium]
MTSFRRAQDNGVPGVSRISLEELRRHEPHVHGVGGVWVPSAGVVDYRAVAGAIADEVAGAGAEILLNQPVVAIRRSGSCVQLATPGGAIDSERVIACGGLQCDRLAGELAASQGVRIIPFRGDYYALRGPSARLIRALVYPVPDARFPSWASTSRVTSAARSPPAPTPCSRWRAKGMEGSTGTS